MLTHDREDTRGPAGKGLIDASFAAHPSNLAMPGDIDKVEKPLSIAVGDDDSVFPTKQSQQAQQILEKKSDIRTELTFYPGARHGFAVRASRSVPDSKETRQAEEAEKQAIKWFQTQFAALKG